MVQSNPLDYEDHHPTAAHVFFLIEIANTSLDCDRTVKAPAYASSRTSEYWVLDVIDRKLHVYRLPSANGYQSETILAEDASVSPIAFPNCVITVREMLHSQG